MSKQNRRINIAKAEARELRAKLAHADNARAVARIAAQTAQHNERDTLAELHALERRLRAFCRAFFLLKPDGSIGPRDYRAAPQSAPFERHYADGYSRHKIAHARAIDLVHMILSASPAEGFPDFRRFVHFRVSSPAGPDFHVAYAVSREVLEYHKLGPEHVTEDLLREFGPALCEALKKFSR